MKKQSLLTFILLQMFALFSFISSAQFGFACSDPIQTQDGNPPEPCLRCCPDCRRSPTYVKTGGFEWNVEDLQLPTRGFPLKVQRNYDSQRNTDGLLGVGGTSNLTVRLTYVTNVFIPPSTYVNEAVIVMPNSKVYRFVDPGGSGTRQFTPPTESHDVLTAFANGTYDLAREVGGGIYHFGSNGNLEYMKDSYGNTLNYTYDGNGKVQQVSDATGSGRFLNIYYGADGRISNIQDSAGRTVGYTYNPDGSMASFTDAAGHITTYTYVTGRYGPVLSLIRDYWGRSIVSVTYDTSDRVSTYTYAGETYTYTYKYQGDPLKTAKSDSAGNLWVFTFNSAGRVTQNVPPSGAGGGTSNTAYNPDGTVSLYTDEVGVKTSYTHNTNGTVASITRDFQGPSSIRFDYMYDSNFPARVISITPKNPSNGTINSDWQEWKYDYYQAGSTAPGALNHVYRVRSNGTTETLSTYSYNSSGQVLTITNATGAVTSYSYDPITGDLISVTHPKNSASGANPVYQYGRDAAGRVTSITNPLGKITSYTYDALDRITSVTLPKPSPSSPLNFTTTYTYDIYDSATGLLFIHQTDPNGKISKQGLDQFDRLGRSVDPANNTTVFTYTKVLLTSIADANNNITTYNYNSIGRLISTQFPDSLIESYTYYPDGLLNTKTDRKNQTITFSYDNLKRLITKTYPGSKTITYTYTGQKPMQVTDSLANPSETHSFAYDTSYRISSNTQATRGTLTYSYDAADKVTSYILSGGYTATYTYYSDGSLNTIQSSLVAGQFQYNYMLTGQYSNINFPNGQHRDFSYDDQGRLTQIANIHPTVGNLATYAYGYDFNHATGQSTMLGQPTSLNATVPSQGFNNHQTKYYYDGNYQLNRVDYPNVAPYNAEIHSWSYDFIGNRLTNTVNSSTQNYIYYKNVGNPNNGQRLQSDGINTYTYDANGNQITKTGSTYTWDEENRLTGIGGATTATYTYDYLGRRTSKTVSGSTVTYIYDGMNLIAERGGSTADYVFGPGIDEPIAIKRSGSTSYYDTDGLGSINVVNNSTGTVKNKYAFDAWGMVRSQTETVSNPFTYTSRESAEVGLMYYRARYYSSAISRFVSEDDVRWTMAMTVYNYPRRFQRFIAPPISFDAYRYAMNTPTKFKDPSGYFDPSQCAFYMSMCAKLSGDSNNEQNRSDSMDEVFMAKINQGSPSVFLFKRCFISKESCQEMFKKCGTLALNPTIGYPLEEEHHWIDEIIDWFHDTIVDMGECCKDKED